MRAHDQRSAWSADAFVRARARRRRRARALLGAALLFVVAILWGLTNPGHSLLVHDVLDHPILLGLVAWCLGAAGAAGLVDDVQRRLVVGVLLFAVGATAFGLAGLVVSMQATRTRTVTTVPAPPGTGLEAVVDDDGAEPRPVARVVVRSSHLSMGARRFEVACVERPAGRDPLAVAWAVPGRLELAAGGRVVATVEVDPDGAPRGEVRVGAACAAG